MHPAHLSAACGVAVLLAGCGASTVSPAAATPAVASRDSSGNIYWNKKSLRLHSPPGTHGKAILTYWAPNGYFTIGPTCAHGGAIAATTHRSWGDPSGYMHVTFWFKAESAGPDECGFSAVLNNTGSPPIAPIKLHIDAP